MIIDNWGIYECVINGLWRLHKALEVILKWDHSRVFCYVLQATVSKGGGHYIQSEQRHLSGHKAHQPTPPSPGESGQCEGQPCQDGGPASCTGQPDCLITTSGPPVSLHHASQMFNAINCFWGGYLFIFNSVYETTRSKECEDSGKMNKRGQTKVYSVYCLSEITEIHSPHDVYSCWNTWPLSTSVSFFFKANHLSLRLVSQIKITVNVHLDYRFERLITNMIQWGRTYPTSILKQAACKCSGMN